MARREVTQDEPLFFTPVKLRKLGLVVPAGETIRVGTYDLGRRYRVLKEGSFPPFKESVATFMCGRTRGGKLVWGDRVGRTSA